MKETNSIARLGGVLLICVCLLILEPGGANLWHRLLLPLLLALGAWLLVQNLAAVAFGATVLAVIHSDPGAGDPITGLAYPALTTLGIAVLTWLFSKRFRARMEATRSARWARRKGAPGERAEP